MTWRRQATLVRVMAWCRQAWVKYIQRLSPFGVTRPLLLQEMSSDQENGYELFDSQQYDASLSNIIVSNVLADELRPLDDGTSAVTGMQHLQ